jgi:hypothetical protein
LGVVVADLAKEVIPSVDDKRLVSLIKRKLSQLLHCHFSCHLLWHFQDVRDITTSNSFMTRQLSKKIRNSSSFLDVNSALSPEFALGFRVGVNDILIKVCWEMKSYASSIE